MGDRGVSAVFGYVLTLGIVTLLVGGLFLAAGNFVENQHDRAVRSEFEVVGNRVAADLAAMDRLALAAGPAGNATLVTDLPPLAAGSSYEITTSPLAGSTTVYLINMTAPELAVDVEVRVKSQTPIVDSTVSGGTVRITFNGTHLEVRDA